MEAMSGTQTKGFLASLGPDHIELIIPAINKSLTDQNQGFSRADIGKIKTLTFSRKGAVGRGALYGFGIGSITGLVIGLAAAEDGFATTREQGIAASTIIMAALGALVGSIIGAFQKKYIYSIDGDLARYQGVRSDLEKFIIVAGSK